MFFETKNQLKEYSGWTGRFLNSIWEGLKKNEIKDSDIVRLIENKK